MLISAGRTLLETEFRCQTRAPDEVGVKEQWSAGAEMPLRLIVCKSCPPYML